MRSLIRRHRLVRTAVAAASVTLLAACGIPTTPSTRVAPTDAPTGAPAKPVPYGAGAVLVSDGTDKVRVGDATVTFPTTVTDAAWSPDGSRIAFVDADGNISTALADGSNRVVLTAAKPGLARARPVWAATFVYFDERVGTKPWVSMATAANGSTDADQPGEFAALGGFHAESGDQLTGGFGATASAGRGPGRELAFLETVGGTTEVWVADTNGRSPFSFKIAKGTEAALSPDGTKVAFVANGQIEVAGTADPNPHAVQVTFGVKSPSRPTWSPDGSRIAFATATDVESVAAAVKSGAKTNPTTRISTGKGVPSYEPASRDVLSRLGAPDPVALSIAASTAMYPTQKVFLPSQSRVMAYGATLVATGDPSLAITRAANGSGPLLLTGGASLDPRTKAELKRTLGSYSGPADGAPIVEIVGDASVISTSTESAVRAMGYQTHRSPGTDVASVTNNSSLQMPYGDVMVVSADDRAGLALATSVYWGSGGSVLFVAVNGTLPAAVHQYLDGRIDAHKVYAADAGAQAALAAAWPGKPAGFSVKAISGAEPMLIAFGAQVNGIVLVNGSSLGDIVVGIGYASRQGSAVIVVDGPAGLDPGALAWFSRSSATIDQVVIVDSAGALGQDLDRSVATAVSGPLGCTSRSLPSAA
jgi:WD40-like Beta Propeller Repeat